MLEAFRRIEVKKYECILVIKSKQVMPAYSFVDPGTMVNYCKKEREDRREVSIKMEGKGGLVRVHFLVIVFFFFKPLAPWWSFDDFCQLCVTIDIIRSTEFRLYLRFFTFI